MTILVSLIQLYKSPDLFLINYYRQRQFMQYYYYY